MFSEIRALKDISNFLICLWSMSMFEVAGRGWVNGQHFIKLFLFPKNLVYFCRRFIIGSNFPFILLDTSYLMLDFNEDASRQSVAIAMAIAASSKSFSIVVISTAGLLPVHHDPASSSAIGDTSSSSLARR